MSRLAIIADDFTGACDAAAPLAAGARVQVVLESPAAWPANTDVLAVDLDARDLRADDARVRAQAAAAALRHLDPTVRLILKIDSTLRGPIGALVAGVLDGAGLAHAIVSPAFPEQGRTFRAARLYVDGEPRDAHLTDVLGAHGARCTIQNATTSGDLRALAAAWSDGADTLLVGSSGLTRQLPLAAHPSAPVPDARLSIFPLHRQPERLLATGPVVIAAGSPTEVTRDQLARLPSLARLTVIRTPPTVTRDRGAAAAEVATRVAALEQPAALIIVGGQTGRLVCVALGAHGIVLDGELAPGIPRGRLVGGVWHDLPTITKAGGFGGPNTLLDVLAALGVSCPHRP